MIKIINTRTKINEKYGIVEVFITDEYNHIFKGKSRCNLQEDIFDTDFGEKLAYLRAKKKMLYYYKKGNERNLEVTRKNMANFEERMAKELNTYSITIERVESDLNKMLENA